MNNANGGNVGRTGYLNREERAGKASITWGNKGDHAGLPLLQLGFISIDNSFTS